MRKIFCKKAKKELKIIFEKDFEQVVRIKGGIKLFGRTRTRAVN
jgi:hypothetical protein